MEPVLIAFLSAATSILVAVGGAWVARRKGLPLINAEIEVRNRELIGLLEGQLAALRSDLKDSQDDFAACKSKLTRALEETADLKTRVSLAEGDLLALQRRGRQQSAQPRSPRRP